MVTRLAGERSRAGRRAALLLGAALATVALRAAAADPAATLPGVVVHGTAPDCGGTRGLSLDCLNAELAHSADDQAGRKELQQLADSAAPPVGDNQIGLYNQAAVRQRLGSNFGHSAFPAQRTGAAAANPALHRIH